MIRGFPNGETHGGKTPVQPDESIVGYERTQGSEPSQYLKEKKEISIPIVVASELGTAQTYCTLMVIKTDQTPAMKVKETVCEAGVNFETVI